MNWTELCSLSVQKFPSGHCHWSMGGVNQVVDVLAVLVGQGIFTASAKDPQIKSHLMQLFKKASIIERTPRF